MIQGFYSAVVGASQLMENMATVGNNIANVNTQGYRAQQSTFQTLMYTMVDGANGETLPKGVGSHIASINTRFAKLTLEHTGRAQDYAILDTNGFFALYDGRTGEISYTRDGSFQIGSMVEDGEVVYYLTDGEGRQVLDAQGNPIPVTDQEAAYPVGVFTFQYLDGLERVGSSRFVPTEKQGEILVANDMEVARGYLKSSNVDLNYEMGKLIETQRAYSYALKMVQTADEVHETVNNLIR